MSTPGDRDEADKPSEAAEQGPAQPGEAAEPSESGNVSGAATQGSPEKPGEADRRSVADKLAALDDEFEVRTPPEAPVMPTAAEARAAASGEPAPRAVQYGLGLLIASGLVCFLASILALLFRQQQIDYEMQNQGPQNHLSLDDISHGVTVQATLLIVAAVVNAAFIWLFGMKVREGDRKSRVRLTVTVVLVGLFQVFFGSPLSSFGVLLGLIGLVMLYVSRAREFFAAR